MNSALVIGAYGFVGRHVARALARRGVGVAAIGHGAWGRGEWRDWGIADWHQADITLETLKTYGGTPDAIFHCAGSGAVTFSMSHPFQDFERTVTTTLAILEYMRTERYNSVLVLPSSAAVYGRVCEMPITTATPLAPVSPYGLHKKLAEDICRSYGQHFGLRCAIVRLFSIYGIGLRKQLLWDACTKLAKGTSQFAGTGRETRDWLHVEDASELMIRACEHASAACPIANGGTGEATPIIVIIEQIAETLSITANLSFSGASRPGDPQHYRADMREAEAWGWKAKRCLQDEVRAYARWFAAGAL